ncbi:Uncharacterised protein [Neisseria lactamica]|nr:hypothetical protein DR91_601 [Neisseria lactamica ATCC 23970]SUA15572.1 Uncharacterised protein [Neisseria lactamica]VTQ48476.1 Uncharacterised protein [Neisseria lactamica]
MLTAAKTACNKGGFLWPQITVYLYIEIFIQKVFSRGLFDSGKYFENF